MLSVLCMLCLLAAGAAIVGAASMLYAKEPSGHMHTPPAPEDVLADFALDGINSGISGSSSISIHGADGAGLFGSSLGQIAEAVVALPSMLAVS